MKIKIPILFPLLILISLISCKKDWNCECTYENTDSSSKTYSIMEDQTKSEAEAACNDSGVSGTFSYSCSLKK